MSTRRPQCLSGEPDDRFHVWLRGPESCCAVTLGDRGRGGYLRPWAVVVGEFMAR